LLQRPRRSFAARPRQNFLSGEQTAHHSCAESDCLSGRRRYRPGSSSQPAEASMIYEMRVYRTVPGRLPALLQRFENVTLKLWEKHGIKQAGFWTTLIGESNHELTYLLAWESLAEREKKWNTFMSDPTWISARAESEKDGPILANATNQILQPTAFSAVK
jgi:hypothetical protein